MKLAMIRKQHGLSVPALSRFSGIPIRTIETIEKNNNCTVKNAIILADALGVTLDELCRDNVVEMN